MSIRSRTTAGRKDTRNRIIWGGDRNENVIGIDALTMKEFGSFQTNRGRLGDQMADLENNLIVAAAGYYIKLNVDKFGNITQAWEYTDFNTLNSDQRAVAVDTENNYYGGGWSTNSFNKFYENSSGNPETIWKYSLPSGGSNCSSINKENTIVVIGTTGNNAGRIIGINTANGDELFNEQVYNAVTRDISYDDDGNIYSVSQDGFIKKHSSDGESITELKSLSVTDKNLFGLCVTPNGEIYVAGGDVTDASFGGWVYKIEEGESSFSIKWALKVDENGLSHQVLFSPYTNRLYACTYTPNPLVVEVQDNGESGFVVESFDGFAGDITNIRTQFEKIGQHPSRF